jgi:hypothetical protein
MRRLRFSRLGFRFYIGLLLPIYSFRAVADQQNTFHDLWFRQRSQRKQGAKEQESESARWSWSKMITVARDPSVSCLTGTPPRGATVVACATIRARDSVARIVGCGCKGREQPVDRTRLHTHLIHTDFRYSRPRSRRRIHRKCEHTSRHCDSWAWLNRKDLAEKGKAKSLECTEIEANIKVSWPVPIWHVRPMYPGGQLQRYPDQ